MDISIFGNGQSEINVTYSFTSNDLFLFDTAYINSFNSAAPELMNNGLQDAFENGEIQQYFPAFSAEQKNTIKKILDSWGDISNINFIERYENSSDTYGDIRFFQFDFEGMRNTIDPNGYLLTQVLLVSPIHH